MSTEQREQRSQAATAQPMVTRHVNVMGVMRPIQMTVEDAARLDEGKARWATKVAARREKAIAAIDHAWRTGGDNISAALDAILQCSLAASSEAQLDAVLPLIERAPADTGSIAD